MLGDEYVCFAGVVKYILLRKDAGVIACGNHALLFEMNFAIDVGCAADMWVKRTNSVNMHSVQPLPAVHVQALHLQANGEGEQHQYRKAAFTQKICSDIYTSSRQLTFGNVWRQTP